MESTDGWDTLLADDDTGIPLPIDGNATVKRERGDMLTCTTANGKVVGAFMYQMRDGMKSLHVTGDVYPWLEVRHSAESM